MKRHFSEKMIHASVTRNYDFDGLHSLHATVRSKTSYLQSSLIYRMKINI
jgi:hypothetical protein